MLKYFFLSAGSMACDPSNAVPGICNPLDKFSVADLPTFLAKVLNDVGSIIGLIAIATLVYAGFRMITANGDKAVIDQAKAVLKYSLFGIIAAVMAYAVVVAVETFIGVNDVDYSRSGLQNPLSQFGNLKVFGEQMIRNVLVIIGSVSLIMVIYNGFRYMTARGNEQQVKDAKQALTWAIAGIILSLFAYTIVSVVANLIS